MFDIDPVTNGWRVLTGGNERGDIYIRRDGFVSYRAMIDRRGAEPADVADHKIAESALRQIGETKIADQIRRRWRAIDTW
jgi:hypothetical protein